MHSSRSRLRLLFAVAASALAAAAVVTPTVGATGQHSTGIAQPAGTLPYQDPTLPVNQRVKDLLSRMTLAEKIGQMTQAERASVDSDTSKITTDNLGSLLSGGGSVPTQEEGRGNVLLTQDGEERNAGLSGIADRIRSAVPL